MSRSPHSLRLMSNSPLLWVLLPLMAGIVMGDVCYAALSGQFVWLIVAALVVLGIPVVRYYMRRRPQHASITVVSAVSASIFFVGAALLVLERIGGEVSWPTDVSTSRVMIVDSPKESAASVRFEGRQLTGPNAGETVSWTLARQPDVPSRQLLPGDILLCRATVSLPRKSGNLGEFDYASWLRRKGVTGAAFCYASQWQFVSSAPWSAMPLSVRALRLRSQLVTRYASYFQGRDLAVLSALTLGEKSRLDTATRDLYSQSGVSHVLALSGLHLSILFSVYQLLVLSFCRSRRWLYVTMSIVGLAGIWNFALLAGFPLSLMRAAIMFSVMQIAGLRQRDSFSVNNLTLAATLILVVSPQALFDVGFQLSCLSVLSILILSPRIPAPSAVACRPWLRWMYDLLKVSLVAQVATAPLVAYYFHTFPVYGLVANLVAVPSAWLILTLSFLFLSLPFAQSLLAPLLSLLLRGMDAVLTAVTDLPGAVLTFYPALPTIFAVYVLMAVLWQMWQSSSSRRRVHLGFAAVGCLACCVVTETYAHRPGRLAPQIIFYNLRSGAAIHFVSSASRSYLWQPFVDVNGRRARDSVALSYVRESFWQPCGMASPTFYTDTLSSPDLYASNGITLFGHKSVAAVCGMLPSLPSHPFPVDYLLIGPDCRTSLPVILRHFYPHTVVLSASLAPWRREAYRKSALAAHLVVYDIATDGALIVSLENVAS